ncbi:MAG: biotin transporter BioY [Lachnospiraceae bacterium]|nr:biotin transporter BioY [Candidatus Equihabitans merdae]
MTATANKTRDIVLCGLFTALIAIGAFIKIPIPVCPFTLQFFFTTMAGIILGGRRGAISVLIYTILGLAGLPIFAEGGGLWYVLKPTFGYMIGFILGSYLTGKLTERYGYDVKHVFAASFAGLLVVYAVGMIYYYILGNFVINAPIGIWALFLYCFLLAVPGDILLCILSAISAKRIIRALRGMN